ncbi:MAG: PEP-CTERM sorting domain-containing protein [Planctomycetota bacterium]|nr:PEP-CTERM sorting domain-containing protein [Planctomycetota bacterium]
MFQIIAHQHPGVGGIVHEQNAPLAFPLAWSGFAMTIIGDPLLVTQEYIPEPASLSLLAVGGMVLLIRRRCK